MSLDFQGLIPLLIFIAPGYLFSRAYLAAKPRYHQSVSAFDQTVLALVGSAGVHSALLGVPALFATVALWILAMRGRGVLSIGQLVGNPPTFLDTSALAVAYWTLGGAAYVSTSLVVGRRAGHWLGRLEPRLAPGWLRRLIADRPPERVLLWYSLLVEEPLRRGIRRPRIVAWLRTGERFEGNLVELRLSADSANLIEMTIEDATYRPKDTTQGEPTGPPGLRGTPLRNHFVSFKSSDVLWLARIDP